MDQGSTPLALVAAHTGKTEKEVIDRLLEREPQKQEPRQNWRMWRNYFDVGLILELPETKEVAQATTFGGENLDYRRSRVAWLSENEQVKAWITPYAQESAAIMGIELSGGVEVQYTEYHASEGGKYDWHHDVDWNSTANTDRKLSLTIQLSHPSEYDGGDFEFSEVTALPDYAKEQGTVMVFPSYLAHRVTPLTRGIRRSLVAWFSGPTWR